jgi:phage replication initiation protein
VKKESRPRTCNTGAQNTLKTGLRACVDWVQATFKIVKPEQLITEVLGLKIDDFTEANGQFGYQKCKRLDNISVFYDGSAGMGIHLQMTGQGCRLYEALTKYDNPWVSIFDVFLKMQGSFSRLDVAIDDFAGYFSINQIVRRIKQGELVSKFKKARSMESIEIKTGESKGMTIYYGSAKSRIQIRMYEKNFERENAGYEIEEDVTCWNRTEVQARNERAQSIAEIIANDGQLGDVVQGILAYYLRFVVKGKDLNKARWKTA